jgi:hypothetical protein
MLYEFKFLTLEIFLIFESNIFFIVINKNKTHNVVHYVVR